MSEHVYAGGRVRVLEGDCLDVLATLDASSVDAVVTDPPYGLGFMGREWDHLPPGREWAEACLRVLKPGGHLLAFGGTRTYHRLACAVEDAGFEIRDSIAWIHGQGFPKSLDVSKAIDKRAEENTETTRRVAAVAAVIRAHREAKGLERAEVSEVVVGTPSGACWNWEHRQLPSVGMWPAIKRALDIPDKFDGLIEGDRAQFIAAEREVIAHQARNGKPPQYMWGESDGRGWDLTAPATPAAQRWQGWGTALKPAVEPVVVARKPLDGTVAANVLTHGTGALNVDGCRVGVGSHVPGGGGLRGGAGTRHEGWQRPSHLSGEATKPHASGRWPSNLVLTHAPGCADPGPCEPGCPVAELDAQSGVRTSGKMMPTHTTAGVNGRGTYGKDAAGGFTTMETYADSGGASRFYPVFRYQPKAPTDERPHAPGVAAHCTVKPLDLMRWLVRLVTPPGGTVLDPFLGSGTTAEACLLERDPVCGHRTRPGLPAADPGQVGPAHGSGGVPGRAGHGRGHVV